MLKQNKTKSAVELLVESNDNGAFWDMIRLLNTQPNVWALDLSMACVERLTYGLDVLYEE